MAKQLGSYSSLVDSSNIRPVTGHLTTLLRSLILDCLIRFGDKQFSKIATAKFEDHCSGGTTIPADLRLPIYRAAIAANGRQAFNSLLKVRKDGRRKNVISWVNRSFSFIAVVPKHRFARREKPNFKFVCGRHRH